MTELIVVSTSGVQLNTVHGNTSSMDWEDINEIHTYKIDAMTHTVTYAVVEHVSGHQLEFRADMQGWDALVEAVASRIHQPVADTRSMISNQMVDGDPVVLYSSADAD